MLRSVQAFALACAVTMNSVPGSFAKKKVAKTDTTEVLHHGPPSYACPPGYNLDGKKCTRRIETPKIPFCTVGILDDAGRCADFVLAQPVCPQGYILDGQQCVRQNSAPRIPICPTGFNMLNNAHGGAALGDGYGGGHKKHGDAGYIQTAECSREVTVPLKHFCPVGTVDSKSHQCVKYASAPPFYHCEGKEYTLQGDRCTRVVHYDCSPNAPAPLAGGLVGGFIDSAKKRLRQLGGKKIKKAPIVEPFAKNEPPRKEHFVVSQQCKKIEDIPALKSCPHGSVPEGKDCRVTTVVQKLSKCPALGDLNHCFQIENAPADFVCPPGFNDGFAGGLDEFGKKKGGAYLDECTNTELAAPSLVCHNGGNMIGDRCMTYAPPQYRCESAGGKHTHKKGSGLAAELDCSYLEFADPIVTYSVKYACTGKDCHPGAKHEHGHGHGGY